MHSTLIRSVGICLLTAQASALSPAPLATTQNGQDKALASMDELAAFPPPAGVSSEQFASWMQGAMKLDSRASQELLEAGRLAMPALINAMLGFDYSTKKGSRQGRDCYRLLSQLVGLEIETPWVITDDLDLHRPNIQLIAKWHKRCQRCLESEDEWWRLRGVELGPALTAVISAGLPASMELELLKLQAELKELRSEFEISRAAATTRLSDMESKRELQLRLELADSLPENWEGEALQVVPPAIIAEQLKGNVKIPWPLGLQEAFQDTLRSSERDASEDQRTIKVDGLKEDIEVSVSSFGKSQYAVVPLARTWPEARDICQANGGHLACIESPEELEAVASLMGALNYTKSQFLESSEVNNFFWVGAGDGKQEGNWRWSDGREVGAWLWLKPLPSAKGDLLTRPHSGAPDPVQPSNNADMEHRAALVGYVGDPELKLDPRWGLMDWYSGFPGRFICEWGPEPFELPWEGETARLLEPFLLDYFRGRAELIEELKEEREREEKKLNRERKKVLSTLRTKTKDLARKLQTTVSSSKAQMTSSQRIAAQRLCWLLEDRESFSVLGGVERAIPADAVSFLNTKYKVFTTPMTHADAEKSCLEMGGRLATLDGFTAAAGLAVGSSSPDLELIRSDLECQLYRAMMRKAGVRDAWMGYRFYQGYGAGEHPRKMRWLELEGSQSVETKWLQGELTPSFILSFGSSWPYHTIGAFMTLFELPAEHVTHLAEPGQQEFPFPYPDLPPFAVKARIDGAEVNEEIKGKGARGFFLDSSSGTAQVRWDGIPFSGGERISFHPSPINSGPINLRLPYICAWDA